eukprot:157629-Rhodomonas_salina.1
MDQHIAARKDLEEVGSILKGGNLRRLVDGEYDEVERPSGRNGSRYCESCMGCGCACARAPTRVLCLVSREWYESARDSCGVTASACVQRGS